LPQFRRGVATHQLKRQLDLFGRNCSFLVLNNFEQISQFPDQSNNSAVVNKLAFTVNGVRRAVEAEDDTPLLWLLRDNLGLTGTKFGCGVGVCGACTVLENGKALRACQIPASAVSSRSFVTIEGLSPNVSHPCQRAWLAEEVAQCGYCQAGMIMTACALLQENPNPSDEQIDHVMSDSVCRCGTYPRMRKAIRRAAEEMRSKNR
jgi:isoquinoline 1-oxidoreductase alpha subunit